MFLFFVYDTATAEIYTYLHIRALPYALPYLFAVHARREARRDRTRPKGNGRPRAERRRRPHRDHRAGKGGAAQGGLIISARERKRAARAGPPFFVGVSATDRTLPSSADRR